METKDCYVCPKCGGKGMVGAIVPLVGNVRYDAVGCECGTQWRVYYEFANATTEVTFMPENAAEDVTGPTIVEE